jgi:soluble lytic murein transglycosylase-like protein
MLRRSIPVVCLAAATLVAWHVVREHPAFRNTAQTRLPSAAPPNQAAVAPQANASVAPPPAEPAETTKSIAPPAQPTSASNEPWGSNTAPISTAGSFVYPKNHPVTPLPALAFAAMTGAEPMNADEFGPTYVVPEKPFDASPGQLKILSRGGLCSAIVAVAKANDLPVPFFANLIWQESSFRSKTISPAGALGIAQFIPETAIEHGLMNPFEPVHALFASGRLLRKLNRQFGNLGLAAAAYNAGPQRVYDWIAVRRGLPAETRAYVVRITGHRADRWLSSEFQRGPESTLMPARAPCAEVATEVRSQTQFVRVAKLMLELAAATAPPPPQDQAHIAALPGESAKSAHDKRAQKKSAPAQASAGKPAARVRIVAGTAKDQSRLPASRAPAKPAHAAANTAIRRVAAQ